VASPVFKTGVTRPSRAGWVRFPHSPATVALLLLAGALLTGLPATARGQRSDSTLSAIGPKTLCRPSTADTSRAPGVPRVVIAGQVEKPPVPDCRVPISPRAALVRSLLVPGLGQFQLYRPKAAALFVVTEVGSYGMVVKSLHDLNLAKAARRDTTIVFVTDANGQPVIDPNTGHQKTIGKPKNQNLVDRIRARSTHVEDWIALIVFNHLFSGADAWVAANLADFDANVNVARVDGGVQLAARFAW
jgi:Family of unknown function (DUF5683)